MKEEMILTKVIDKSIGFKKANSSQVKNETEAGIFRCNIFCQILLTRE